MKDLRKWSIFTYKMMRIVLYDLKYYKMAKGYRQMLCDRMPQTLDIALRWCKCKNKWVDHVYDNIIQKHPQCERSKAVKQVLGLLNYYDSYEIIMYFRTIGKKQCKDIPKDDLKLSFKETINWQALASKDIDELNNWQAVVSWVTWFKYWYQYIENTAKISMAKGKAYNEICKEIENTYLVKVNATIKEKLSTFLVDNIKKFNKI